MCALQRYWIVLVKKETIDTFNEIVIHYVIFKIISAQKRNFQRFLNEIDRHCLEAEILWSDENHNYASHWTFLNDHKEAHALIWNVWAILIVLNKLSRPFTQNGHHEWINIYQQSANLCRSIISFHFCLCWSKNHWSKVTSAARWYYHAFFVIFVVVLVSKSVVLSRKD